MPAPHSSLNLISNTMAAALDIDWLTGPAAAPWLELAAQWDGEALPLLTRLRKDLTAERARLVVEQAELRRRAAEKFSQSARMFFTARGLEQATDEALARYKAGRFPAGRSADFCCGIGGDLLGIAERGSVIGVERDPVVATLASANVQALSGRRLFARGGAQVLVEDVAHSSVADCAAWHLDPDRRPTGNRTTRVAMHEPGPEVLARLWGLCPNAAIKLAPAADIARVNHTASSTQSTLDWEQAELEWISRKGECRQLVAWFGSLAQQPGRRRATRLSSNLSACGTELVAASFAGSPHIQPAVARSIGRFVFEPDPSLLAADLHGMLADELRLHCVGNTAYLTADEWQDSPLLDAFEVLEVMPYRVKAIKAWLRARRIGRLEVKKRGVDLDPPEVQRELQVPGDEQATLLLCRIDRKAMAILARRAV